MLRTETAWCHLLGHARVAKHACEHTCSADSPAVMQACKTPVQTAHRTSCLGLQGLAREALTLLEGALALWPATPVKLHYIEKLIQTNHAANVDPPPALIIGGRKLAAVPCIC